MISVDPNLLGGGKFYSGGYVLRVPGRRMSLQTDRLNGEIQFLSISQSSALNPVDTKEQGCGKQDYIFGHIK